MLKKNKHTNRTSSRITAVGKSFFIHQDAPKIGKYEYQQTLAGLPGQTTSEEAQYPAYCYVDVEGQYVIDEDNLVWCKLHHFRFAQDEITPATDYDMTFRFCRENFAWYQSTEGTAPTSQWAFPLVKDFSEKVESDRHFDHIYNSGTDFITVEEAEKGITVNDNMDGPSKFDRFQVIGYLSELEHDEQNIYIYYSSCGTYSVTNPAYPLVTRWSHSFDEVPFDYYPCSIFNNADNKFVSCNNPGHSLTMFDGSSFRDIKNYEHDSAGDSKGFMYYNDNWNKIAKG